MWANRTLLEKYLIVLVLLKLLLIIILAIVLSASNPSARVLHVQNSGKCLPILFYFFTFVGSSWA